MSSPRTWFVLIGATVLMAPVALGLPVAQGVLDDAGSGADAGDTRAQAMPLAYGLYSGNMSLFDADWYAFAGASTPACLRAGVNAGHPMGIEVGAGSAARVERLLNGSGMFSTVLAVSPGSAATLGLQPDAGFLDGAASVGAYAFDVTVSAATLVGDGKVSDPVGDAGSTRATSRALPGDCFAGHLRSSDGDVDVFAFTGQAGSAITYSLGSTLSTARLEIWDATGVLASIGAGGAGTLTLPTDGTFYLAAMSTPGSADGRYTAALVIGPPDPGSSCRPMCRA